MSAIMQNVIYTEHRTLDIAMLGVVLLNAIMLSVIVLNVIMPSVVAPQMTSVKKCYDIVTWPQCYKTFLSVLYGF